jgi:translation elongation factor EF-1beta
MTQTKLPSNTSTDKDSQKKNPKADEPRKYSKFNELEVAIAFGFTGLAVVYLPDVVCSLS